MFEDKNEIIKRGKEMEGEKKGGEGKGSRGQVWGGNTKETA